LAVSVAKLDRLRTFMLRYGKLWQCLRRDKLTDKGAYLWHY
jgi:hypothetical protein